VFRDVEGVRIDLGLDWLQTGPQTWDVRVETDRGVLVLSQGGSRMEVDAPSWREAPEAEYAGLYAASPRLIRERRSDVDVSPLRHVADAFMIGPARPWRRSSTETRRRPGPEVTREADPAEATGLASPTRPLSQQENCCSGPGDEDVAPRREQS
jgi:hypothetical protein